MAATFDLPIFDTKSKSILRDTKSMSSFSHLGDLSL